MIKRDRSMVSQALYNSLLNVFWSVLAFLPVATFCYRCMERAWLYLFVGLSLLAYIVPTAILRLLELSSNPTLYRQLGVRWINHVAQHGTLINGLTRRREPNYRRVSSRVAAKNLIRTTYFQERFHWAMLILFALCSIYAVVHRHGDWALLITATNVIYNLYPIWLQQYIRIRLRRYVSHS